LEHARTAEEAKKMVQVAAERKKGFFEEVLSSFTAHGCTLGVLLLYISDPLSKQGQARWENLFHDRTSIPRLLNFWTFQSSPAAQEQVHLWAVDYISEEVKRKAQQITKSQYIQTHNRIVDTTMFLGFKLTAIGAHL
jgi:hypothetical protein